MGFENPLTLLASELAIDLGTANTIVAVRGQGIVLDEPSVLAIRQRGGSREVVAVGAGARQMLGRTPEDIRAARPLEGSVILDYDAAEIMLRYFIARVLGKRPLVKPRALVTVPLGLSQEQRRAVQDCTRAAGCREVRLVCAPLAAAYGAGLPVGEPTGTLICDLGAGTTELAVISLGGVVASQSLQCAGDAMDRAIVEHLARAHQIEIGVQSAEAVKIELGIEAASGRSLTVTGRQVGGGLPRQVVLGAADVAAALGPCIEALIEALHQTFARTPPDLAADILDAGLVLTGGGALLAGLEERLGQATGLPVVRAEHPLRAAVAGAEALLDEPALLKTLA
ncbi:MAG: rod shape-determining protein [Pseudomonadota bacterium]